MNPFEEGVKMVEDISTLANWRNRAIHRKEARLPSWQVGSNFRVSWKTDNSLAALNEIP